MKVLSLSVGFLGVNCYIVCCEQTGDCAVIDPGGDCDGIVRRIEENHLKPEYILLTHGHFDHIGAVTELKERTGAELVIHPEDAGLLTDADRNLSRLFGVGSVQVKVPPDRFLSDGDKLEIGNVVLKVIHTPGHTMGGVTYMGDGILFTGDTLMKGAVGRTDMAEGNYPLLMKSLSEKLLILDDGLLVCPGHGGRSTLGQERRTNPFLQDMGGFGTE